MICSLFGVYIAFPSVAITVSHSYPNILFWSFCLVPVDQHSYGLGICHAERVAATMVDTAKRKENSTKVFLFKPNTTPPTIVAADLKVQRDYYRAIEVVMQRTQLHAEDRFGLPEKQVKENRV